LQCELRLGGGCEDEDNTGNETGRYIKEWTVAVLAKTETVADFNSCSVNRSWAAAATATSTSTS
jgi:hypothetical protein